MTETEEKPRKKSPTKKGLHGWKAALAVVGCGTLAAFGVFGVIVVIASLFLNATSSQEASSGSENDPIAGVGQTAIPRDSTGTGDIDLCGVTISQVDEVHASRQDDEETYSDPGEGEVPRSVTDECRWTVHPSLDSSSSMQMDFSYEAFITDESGEEASDLAEEDFQERASRIDALDVESISSGDAGLQPESHYVYGTTSDGSTIYALVVRSGDTVYEMIFNVGSDEVNGGSASIDSFENERDWLVSYIEARLGTVGPR